MRKKTKHRPHRQAGTHAKSSETLGGRILSKKSLGDTLAEPPGASTKATRNFLPEQKGKEGARGTPKWEKNPMATTSEARREKQEGKNDESPLPSESKRERGEVRGVKDPGQGPRHLRPGGYRRLLRKGHGRSTQKKKETLRGRVQKRYL